MERHSGTGKKKFAQYVLERRELMVIQPSRGSAPAGSRLTTQDERVVSSYATLLGELLECLEQFARE